MFTGPVSLVLCCAVSAQECGERSHLWGGRQSAECDHQQLGDHFWLFVFNKICCLFKYFGFIKYDFSKYGFKICFVLLFSICSMNCSQQDLPWFFGSQQTNQMVKKIRTNLKAKSFFLEKNTCPKRLSIVFSRFFWWTKNRCFNAKPQAGAWTLQ